MVWELKDNLDSTPNLADPHDADNTYTWSTGAPWKEDSTAFLAVVQMNALGLAGSLGWRLPTVAEVQTIVLDFPCTGAFAGSKCNCPVTFPVPCVDPALDAANTQSSFYWSASTYAPDPSSAWIVYFDIGLVTYHYKASAGYVRAVRSGL